MIEYIPSVREKKKRFGVTVEMDTKKCVRQPHAGFEPATCGLEGGHATIASMRLTQGMNPVDSNVPKMVVIYL